MASKVESITGRSILDKLFYLIDYRGDIKRNEKTGVKVYSPDYSPNNIRRLIISPDCVAVHYHVPVSGTTVKFHKLDASYFSRVASLLDYKPVISLLHADRICASVEETILLGKSAVGNYTLTAKELNIAGLIANYQNKQGDLMSIIAERYKRLRAFVVAPNISYSEFCSAVSLSYANNPANAIYKLPIFSNATVHTVHIEKDWYKKWGSSGQFYDMDKEAGKLHKHFREVVTQLDQAAKTDEKDAFTRERTKGLHDDMLRILKDYKLVLRLSSVLDDITKDLAWSGMLTNRPIPANLVRLKKCSVTTEERYSAILNDECSESDALRYNIDELKKAIGGVASSFGNLLVNNVIACGNLFPTTLKVAIGSIGREHDISALPLSVEMQAKLSEFNTLTGREFVVAKDLRVACANACWLLCYIFLNRECNDKYYRYLDYNTWKEVFR